MKRTESTSVISFDWLMEQLTNSDEKKLPLGSGYNIYRVPTKLKKDNEEAYTPTLISIGPFHHGDKRLESMQDFKLWFFKKFMKRNPEKAPDNYLEAIIRREDEIRYYYSETIHMSSDELGSIILMDSCFIIEFFLALTALSEGSHHLVNNPWPTGYIKLDLLLLENQLPFFVLEDLFNIARPIGFNNNIPSSFVEVAFNFFKKEFSRDTVPIELELSFGNFQEHYLNQRTTPGPCPYHLNDMLRIFYLPHPLPPRVVDPFVKPIRSASQLSEAGIKFRVCKKSTITKVQYSEGKLTIPCFVARDWTETMIRNVVAFEQCHLPNDSFVTDYIMLWDHLINTEKDVELLVRKGIIENFLSDNNAVASMINRLCRNVVSTSYNREYVYLHQDLNLFYNNTCHKYKAIFRHEYCSTPWRIASTIAAIVLLVLTFIQTISSLIPLFQKKD